MSRYPELFQLQADNYASEHVDWRLIAEQVFPAFPEQINAMEQARSNILEHYRSVCARAHRKLGIEFELTLVVYVGTGCGAGWATTYAGKPALLMGLENIAQEGWHTRDRIEGLIAHEIGHLAHSRWRSGLGPMGEDEDDPLMLLYSEGFAQRCEHVINGRDTWHLSPDQGWFSWCARNTGRLAAEFLRRLEAGNPVNDFFGSWHHIEGRKMTGYFMGHDFVAGLERSRGLADIAVLESAEVNKLAREYLSSAAAARS